jgi:hypothetical protein
VNAPPAKDSDNFQEIDTLKITANGGNQDSITSGRR